jgi:uncharacterized delta-60 repeat protein
MGNFVHSFGNNGVVYSDDVNHGDESAAGLAIQPDGKLLIAGDYAPTTGSSRNPDFSLYRYNADGSPDASFGSGSGMVLTDFGSYDYPSGLLIQQDGKIVVFGSPIYGCLFARYWP